jgi:hypothetical protein
MRQVLVQAHPRQAPAQQARERRLARRAARAAISCTHSDPVGGCSPDEGRQGSMKPVGVRNNMWRN